MINHTKIERFVSKYLNHVSGRGIDAHLYDEGYKFHCVAKFQENFDIAADDPRVMLESSIENNNLSSGPNYFPRNMLLLFAAEYPNETRQALKTLLDDTLEIGRRIDEASQAFKEIMGRRNTDKQQSLRSYIGLRFISLLLSLRYPTQHYPVKTTEYDRFCSFIDDDFHELTRKLTTGEKYELYARYASTLAEYIRAVPEVERIHTAFTKDTVFKDPAYIWMTQDVIYTGAAIDLRAPPEDIRQVLELLTVKRQVILYGPPGTGKTYLAKYCSIEMMNDEV